MCGIAGMVDPRGLDTQPTREALKRMASALYHRGPDEFGIYVDSHAGLAHARLSILDVAGGQQPLSNEDGTIWIAFNGEIYNYKQLRTELMKLGHRFKTRSDTEVIVHAYEAWGNGAFSRLNGQWAIALWDEKTKRLVLSRDPVGIHPLYIAAYRGCVYFASEVKAIFAANSSIPRVLDPVGIDQIFTFWTIVPPQSVFKGIEELPPGHIRTYEYDGSRLRVSTVKTVESSAHLGQFAGSIEDASSAVRSALEHATAQRMLQADVPVGCYLSGGLDSSLVAALGRRFAGGDFQTFSLRFEDAEYDETAYQRLMVQRLASTHHELVVSKGDIAKAFPDVILHTERPILRTASAPLFLLSKLVRESGVKVVLTGEGADEMFAGYDLFREGKIRRFWAKFPDSKLRPKLLNRLYPYLLRSPVNQQAMGQHFFGRNLQNHSTPGFAHETRWHTTNALKRFFSKELHSELIGRDAVSDFLDTLPREFTRWGPLSQDQYIESHTLLSGYLLSCQGDRMLMAHSLEGRFPFIDKNVIELADSLPEKYKLRGLDEKHVLKRAARGLVSNEIINRTKQPYRAPDATSFLTEDTPAYVDELLSDKNVAEAGIFEPQAISQLWRKCKKSSGLGPLSNADNMALVGAISTQLVHHFYIRGQPAIDRSISLCTDVNRSQTALI